MTVAGSQQYRRRKRGWGDRYLAVHVARIYWRCHKLSDQNEERRAAPPSVEFENVTSQFWHWSAVASVKTDHLRVHYDSNTHNTTWHDLQITAKDAPKIAPYNVDTLAKQLTLDKWCNSLYTYYVCTCTCIYKLSWRQWPHAKYHQTKVRNHSEAKLLASDFI